MIDAAGVDWRGLIQKGFILENWTLLEQVPLKAWFRLASNPQKVFAITSIDLQYAGGYMPGNTLKAGPAVLIDMQWWRPSELSAAFEYSFDAGHWMECKGDAVDNVFDAVESLRAMIDELNQRSNETVSRLIGVVEVQAKKIEDLTTAVADVKKLAHSHEGTAPKTPEPAQDPKGKKS